jgi:hypothetical protein
MANKKILTGMLAVLLAFAAMGTASLFAQQETRWNPDGKQCFSLAGVEYYYDAHSGGGETVLKNHNNDGVTVLYTTQNGNGRQQSTWIEAGGVKRLGGRVRIDQCFGD